MTSSKCLQKAKTTQDVTCDAESQVLMNPFCLDKNHPTF